MRRYTEEEKREILKEVESLRNVSLVAKKHGIPATTIQNWIRKGFNPSNPSEIQKQDVLILCLKITILTTFRLFLPTDSREELDFKRSYTKKYFKIDKNTEFFYFSTKTHTKY